MYPQIRSEKYGILQGIGVLSKDKIVVFWYPKYYHNGLGIMRIHDNLYANTVMLILTDNDQGELKVEQFDEELNSCLTEFPTQGRIC